jgi:hypothetical protein
MATSFAPLLLQALDNYGAVLAGGKVYTYQAGTTTNLATYQDYDGAVPNTNPVTLDAAGRGTIRITNNVAYKFVVKDASLNTLATLDNIMVTGASTNINEVDLSGAVLRGTHTIPVLVGSMIANTTNGPSSGTSESATNKVMLRTLDYDASTDESAQITIPMPKSWNEGTVTVQFIWTAGATGNVVWGCAARAFSDDDAIDAAFGTAQTVTDGVTAAGDVMESAFTSAITIAGSPTTEDIVVFKFYRDADNVSDSLAADAKLIGVRIKYTVSGGDDA